LVTLLRLLRLVFWVVTSFHLLNSYQHIGAAYCLHFHCLAVLCW